MNKGYLQFIILYCLQQFNGERSPSAIYHLLQGKKSSQTLQDSKFFGLGFLFGVLKNVSREDIYKVIRTMEEKQLLLRVNERNYKLTKSGGLFLYEGLSKLPLPKHLNGLTYNQETIVFWQRLSLVVQTVSNLLHNRNFEPIHRHEESLRWLKRFILSGKRELHQLGKSLYLELEHLLSSLPEDEATVFILRLTSYERIGWTYEQIAIFFERDPIYIQLTFQHVLHYMLATLRKVPYRFPVLSGLLVEQSFSAPLTVSTKKTYELLLKGKTIEQISKVRGLKRNTIEDHIVEIAANIHDFSITPFVDDKTRKMIIYYAEKLRTKQLKKIKEALNGTVSYFEIRLVLAKRENMNES